MNEDLNQRVSWDYDFTESDYSEESVLLPPGNYPYEVVKVEKTSFPGSSKLCASPMAKVTVALDGGELGRGLTTVNLILNKKILWKIADFFVSCGLRKHGQQGGMPFDEALHATGRCHASIRKFTGKDGVEREVQDVDRWLEPEKSLARPAPVRTAPKVAPRPAPAPAPAQTVQQAVADAAEYGDLPF